MRWPFSRAAAEPDPDAPALAVQGLVRRFGAVTAIDGLDLRVPRGELYGLVGPDGAGKTTAIRAFAGLLDPDGGTVRLLGLDPRTAAAREQVGLMPQRYALYGDLSVDENLAFFGDLFAVPRDLYAARRERLLQLTRLARFGDRRADALSGGMYKKLALACALLHEPPVLLLDEPTNGVDPVSRRELWALLHELVSGGTTVVVTTPYMDEAERCHRVGLLYDGRLLAEGDPVRWAQEHGSFEAFFVQTLEAA
jgi:ABC-2 type transport system ATP-binding protein